MGKVVLRKIFFRNMIDRVWAPLLFYLVMEVARYSRNVGELIPDYTA
jgi:hypothetical protein